MDLRGAGDGVLFSRVCCGQVNRRCSEEQETQIVHDEWKCAAPVTPSSRCVLVRCRPWIFSLWNVWIGSGDSFFTVRCSVSMLVLLRAPGELAIEVDMPLAVVA